ncbi:MAG TPA: peptidoglycan-binding domain-containing protein [Terriglobales bacterium]
MQQSKTHLVFFASLTLLLAVPATAKNVKDSGVSSRHTGQSPHVRHAKKSHRATRGSWKRRGQQQISSDRVREIQEALIRERYMNGEPTGVFDQRTKTALAKLQADQGWQSKVVPDSRALIKLGLGPNHDGAINLEASSDKTSPLKSTDSLPPIPQQ